VTHEVSFYSKKNDKNLGKNIQVFISENPFLLSHFAGPGVWELLVRQNAAATAAPCAEHASRAVRGGVGRLSPVRWQPFFLSFCVV
jgi:hypothetical protein